MLVAKGYTQQNEINYSTTFNPVIKVITIRTILTIIISKRWILRQLNISNAFLNINIKKQIFMTQSHGFVDDRCPQYISKSQKFIYGGMVLKFEFLFFFAYYWIYKFTCCFFLYL